jgi:polyphosphate kinase
MVPIAQPDHLEQLGELLDLGFDPGTSSWWLDAEGAWTRHKTSDAGAPLLDVQNALIAIHRRRREDIVGHR